MIHLREELKRNQLSQLTIDLFWLHSENGIDGLTNKMKSNEIEYFCPLFDNKFL